MNRHKSDDHSDMTERLRQLEQMLAPRVVAPRSAADDAIESKPLLAVQKHMGRMYVAGHEPHFRPITLLKPTHTQPEDGLDRA